MEPFAYRYIADSKNFLERTVWIVLTITSFGLAGLLIGSNLKEASNNPITTSVIKIPVQVSVMDTLDFLCKSLSRTQMFHRVFPSRQ